MDEIERLRAALLIYADPAHWSIEPKNIGHGDSCNAVAWKGPPEARPAGYGPFKGPEYARDALGMGEPGPLGQTILGQDMGEDFWEKYRALHTAMAKAAKPTASGE
jgi:hypothetical protein